MAGGFSHCCRSLGCGGLSDWGDGGVDVVEPARGWLDKTFISHEAE